MKALNLNRINEQYQTRKFRISCDAKLCTTISRAHPKRLLGLFCSFSALRVFSGSGDGAPIHLPCQRRTAPVNTPMQIKIKCPQNNLNSSAVEVKEKKRKEEKKKTIYCCNMQTETSIRRPAPSVAIARGTATPHELFINNKT